MVETVLESHSVGETTPLGGHDDEPPPADPTQIGRYTVLRPIGRGGMARVYQGWDPQLSRTVAIKVLQVGRRRLEHVQSRLRREAQALARLVHPNVVEVYDVEVDRSSLCIVMELIEGRTVHQWLQEGPDWPEVVEVMLEAARGLSAAHHCGLLHRDFKPANVMIRRADSRVLVMDFGLARALDSTDDLPFDFESEASDDPFLAIVTGHGEVVGTPAYMSPEQQRGHALGEATDQFSFCVALFEALHGVRPFRGKTRRQLFREKSAGIFEHPRDTEVPRRIRAVVDRGLSVDPDERFENMDRLIAALEEARKPPARRWPMAAAGVAAIAFGVFAAWTPGANGPLCASEDGLQGIWDDERREQVHQVVTSTLGPSGPGQYDKLAHRLDDYAGAWTKAYARACEDSSATERDATMACLRAARSELDGIVDAMLTVVDPTDLASATAAAWELPVVAQCSERRGSSLETTVSRRSVRKRQRLENRLERARGLNSSGQSGRALSMLDRMMSEVRELGDARLLARAMLLRGRALVELGRYDEAVTVLEAAYATSLDASLFLQSADAATALVDLQTVRGRWSEAEPWAEHAASWLRRADIEPRGRLAALGRARSRLAADRGDIHASAALAEQALELARAEFEGPRLIPYVVAMGNARLRSSDFAGAKNSYAEALTLAHESYGEGHLSTAPIINNLAAVHYREFDFKEAATLFGRAYEIEAAVVPDDDPRLASNLSNYATALAESGSFEEAEPKLRKAIAMFERQYGKDHPRVGNGWTNLGAALHSMGRLDDAKEAYTTAIELMRDGFGPEHPKTADALGNLATLERALGNVEEARRLHTEVLEIRTVTLGPEHAGVALALNNLADIEFTDGNPERARALNEQALKIYTEVSGPESQGVADSRYQLGRLALRAGEAAAAREHLEASLRTRERLDSDRASLGRTRFWLAKALSASGDEPTRARDLARRAVEDFEAMSGPPRSSEIREIRAWLAGRGGADAATLRPL